MGPQGPANPAFFPTPPKKHLLGLKKPGNGALKLGGEWGRAFFWGPGLPSDGPPVGPGPQKGPGGRGSTPNREASLGPPKRGALDPPGGSKNHKSPSGPRPGGGVSSSGFPGPGLTSPLEGFGGVPPGARGGLGGDPAPQSPFLGGPLAALPPNGGGGPQWGTRGGAARARGRVDPRGNPPIFLFLSSRPWAFFFIDPIEKKMMKNSLC